MTIRRIAAVTAVFAGTAIGLAGGANAAPLEGTYTAALVGSEGSAMAQWVSRAWMFTPCGATCTTVGWGGAKTSELHLQGNTWTGTYFDDIDNCVVTLDAGSLLAKINCGDGRQILTEQLTPGGEQPAAG